MWTDNSLPSAMVGSNVCQVWCINRSIEETTVVRNSIFFSIYYTNANLYFDKKKNRELANTLPSLHFYGMIILLKKGLCRGMAWLPFQKDKRRSGERESQTDRQIKYLQSDYATTHVCCCCCHG